MVCVALAPAAVSTISRAVRALTVLFGGSEYVKLPLPVPVGGVESGNQAASLRAIHVHEGELTVTVTLLLPPNALKEAAAGLTETVHAGRTSTCSDPRAVL